MEWIALILMCALGFGSAIKTGPYFLEINSLLDYLPPNPDKVDFLFYIQQKNISHRVIQGFMNVNEATGPLLVHYEIIFWTDTGFKPVSGHGRTVSACLTRSHLTLLQSFYPQEGFDTATCSFQPGKYELRDVDFNAIFHLDSKMAPYGRKIFVMDYTTEAKVNLFGFRIDNEVISLEAYEYENGRGNEYRN